MSPYTSFPTNIRRARPYTKIYSSRTASAPVKLGGACTVHCSLYALGQASSRPHREPLAAAACLPRSCDPLIYLRLRRWHANPVFPLRRCGQRGPEEEESEPRRADQHATQLLQEGNVTSPSQPSARRSFASHGGMPTTGRGGIDCRSYTLSAGTPASKLKIDLCEKDQNRITPLALALACPVFRSGSSAQPCSLIVPVPQSSFHLIPLLVSPASLAPAPTPTPKGFPVL